MSSEDEVNREEALSLLKELKGSTTLWLPKFRVVKNFYWYDERNRHFMVEIFEKIRDSILETDSRQQNFLIWGTSKTGKTWFIEQLRREFSENIYYGSVNMSEMSTSEAFKSWCETHYKDDVRQRPRLFFIDELDTRAHFQWLYEDLRSVLDTGITRSSRTTFILAGSNPPVLSEFVSGIKAEQSKNNLQGVDDFLNRIPDKDRFQIPDPSLGDRILIAIVQLVMNGLKSRKILNEAKAIEVEELALYHIARTPRYEKLGEIDRLARQCMKDIPNGSKRILFEDLFPRGTMGEMVEFLKKEGDYANNFKGHFIWVQYDEVLEPVPLYATNEFDVLADRTKSSNTRAQLANHETKMSRNQLELPSISMDVEIQKDGILYWDDIRYERCIGTRTTNLGLTLRIQHMPTGILKSETDYAVATILSRILNAQSSDGIWVIKPASDQFETIYATTSVLYFLLQIGFDLSDSVVKMAIDHLDRVQDISVDTRAKWFFDVLTHRITEAHTVALCNLLEKNQSKNPSELGSFLFQQGKTIPTQNGEHWKSLHPGGRAFHACHIADVLLHIPEDYKSARKIATRILIEIKGYLERMLMEGKGYIVDSFGLKSGQLTLWAYSLARPLFLSLPPNWRTNVLEVLASREGQLMEKAFSMMNVCQFFYTQGELWDEQISRSAIQYIKSGLNELKEMASDLSLNPRDLSVIGRAILYGTLVLDRDASYVMIKHVKKILSEQN
jgi:hypothetical protein